MHMVCMRFTSRFVCFCSCCFSQRSLTFSNFQLQLEMVVVIL